MKMQLEPESWIVDDIQRVVNVEKTTVLEDGKIRVDAPRTHKGMIFSPEFVYPDETSANQEVRDRHTRLNKAFIERDLLACLSINKETQRKTTGLTADELQKEAVNDKKDYNSWLETIKHDWEQINHEKPDLQRIVLILRNSKLIADALANPLAIDFIEIMAREERTKVKEPENRQTPEVG